MPYSRNQQFASRNRNQHSSAPRRAAPKEYIHPSRFVRAAVQQVEREVYKPAHAFASFELVPLVHNNVMAKGFADPTPIQDQTIPLGLQGRDIVGIANTGTGKTAAFAIPVLNRVIQDQQARALILAPTRELAQQIETEFHSIGKGSDLSGALLIGGTSMGPQLRDLRYNPRVVIGTPGRTKDHIRQGTLDLSRFNILVLDEVDQMLDMGFVNDVRFILQELAQPRQSFFFSATLDTRVKSIIETFSNNPAWVMVKTGETADSVDQNVVQYSSKEEKLQKLHDLLGSREVTKALIFDDTQRSVEKLHKELSNRGFASDSIHGGKSQSQRQRALQRFKDNQVTMLVATDVAARGIDIPDVTHVINYATPKSYHDYVHRIGRAGRAGRAGSALTFIER